jgi:ribosomal protein L15
MVKYDPDHFGAYGFVRHAQIRTTTTINLEDVFVRLSEFEAAGHAKREGDRIAVDLTAAGIDKLLSRGRIAVPMTITVARASQGAVAKVTAAGGKVVLPSKAED